MSLLDRILACDNADLRAFAPLAAGGVRIGFVHRDRVPLLLRLSDALGDAGDAVRLLPADREGRTRAVGGLHRALAAEGLARPPTGETYSVGPAFGAEPFLEADRAALPEFGFRAYGVHLVGYVPGPEGPSIWVPRRARDRGIAPGLLDNTVAGGIAAGEGVLETLVRECAEEAGFAPELAGRARPAGALAYLFQEGESLRDDVLFVYDLAVPEDVAPVNRDGEVEGFRLVPWREVAAVLRDSDRFKFNCGPVLVDFLLRHGLLDPDREPGYAELARAIRRREPPRADGP